MRTLLISAYACEPLKGSEQGVGWNWVLQMAKNNKVHVITRANNQTVIEANLPNNVAQNITFHYYDTHRYILGLKNKAKGLYFYYICWQFGILPLILKLTKKYYFDYSMHLTFGNVWLPTFLPFINIPFIWGTIGGAETIPNSFIQILPFRQKIIQISRLILITTARFNPFIIFASFKAEAILCRSVNTANIFLKIFRSKIYIISDGAIEPEIFKYKVTSNFKTLNNVIQLTTTSRLVPFKNIITAVKAIKYIPDNYMVHLTIIGSGTEQHRLNNEIVKYKLNHKVKLIPEVTRNEVLNMLTKSDIFLSPSLREANNLSLLEAMAVGLPVICLNWSGMAISTDESSAIRLPVTNPVQMPKDMAKAIIQLIENPALRIQMGAAGRKRIKEVFNWDAKGVFMEQLLKELDKKKTITL